MMNRKPSQLADSQGGLPREYSRREWLWQSAAAATCGLVTPCVSLASPPKSAIGPAPRADSLIILHLNGGPSHLDMWDIKPNLPDEIRSQFQPIASSLPGVSLCEHLPLLAKQMHHCALVRSMHHSVNNSHALAVYVSLTGHDRGEKGGGALPSDNPTPGATTGTSVTP